MASATAEPVAKEAKKRQVALITGITGQVSENQTGSSNGLICFLYVL